MLSELSFLFLKESGWASNHGRLINYFTKLTANTHLSQNLQPVRLFLQMYYIQCLIPFFIGLLPISRFQQVQ